MEGEKVWRWGATRAEKKLTRQLVPKRLQATWRAGYCWRRADVMMLRRAPKSCDTALAFALEEVSGEGVCLGGVLALRKTDPIVQDCWTLLRLRQKGYCVRCGGRGHLAGDAAACEQRLGGLQGDELPYNQQRLERTLRAADAALPVAQAVREPTLPLAVAQSSSLAGDVAQPPGEGGDTLEEGWAAWITRNGVTTVTGWLKLPDFLRAVGASDSERRKTGIFVLPGWHRVGGGAPRLQKEYKYLKGQRNRGGRGKGTLYVSEAFAHHARRQCYPHAE